MAAATLNLAGKKFVVIPADEYRQLKAKASRSRKQGASKTRLSRQDRGDIAESIRRMKSEKFIPLDEVARELGFEPGDLKSE